MTGTVTNQYIPKIGEGIFLTKDVSQILKLPYRKVQYFMTEFWDAIFSDDGLQVFGEKGNKAVNFNTLIEFYTFYHLKNNGFTTKKVKSFHYIIAKTLKAKYPFALDIVPMEKMCGLNIWNT